MKLPTDSELKGRWEKASSELKRTKDDSRRNELNRELDLIKVEWQGLLQQKRLGVLTDTANVDAIQKIARGVALMHGLSLDFGVEEGMRSADHIADFWRVVTIMKCNSEDHRDRFGVAATNEIKSRHLILGKQCVAIAGLVLDNDAEDTEEEMLQRYTIRGYNKDTGNALIAWAAKEVWLGPDARDLPALRLR